MNRPPEISDDQRREYGLRAVAARQKRAQFKRRLKQGSISVTEALAKLDDPDIDRLKVEEFIAALPGIGETRARRIMAELQINPRRRLKGLGNRQLSRLQEYLMNNYD